MEAFLVRGVQLLIALVGAYLVALWFALIVWTFQDIQARSRSVMAQIFSTLVVVLFFVPGVLIYLILRPSETLDEAYQRSLEEEYLLQDLDELPVCPSCRRYARDDFVWCPSCRYEIRQPCSECERLVDRRWAACPYCGAAQFSPVEIPPESERLGRAMADGPTSTTLPDLVLQARARLGARWPRFLPKEGDRSQFSSAPSSKSFAFPFWRSNAKSDHSAEPPPWNPSTRSDGHGQESMSGSWNPSSDQNDDAGSDRTDELPAETRSSQE
jgi:RNA polymerase subunit RPABC4/transcription elongation factor Spt4